MMILLLKVEKPGRTTLHFIGVLGSRQDAQKHVDGRFGLLEETHLGNRRMLEARHGRLPLKGVWATKAIQEKACVQESYLLAEY